MDEARESREMPEVPLLHYATRAEGADALRAYRLVGIALLLYYGGGIAAWCMMVAGNYQAGMRAWTDYVQPGVVMLLFAAGLAGAICMTLQLRAGTWLVVAGAALRIGIQCYYFLTAAISMRLGRPGRFLESVGSTTGTVLEPAAIALLAYLFWDHCRRRGAWG